MCVILAPPPSSSGFSTSCSKTHLVGVVPTVVVIIVAVIPDNPQPEGLDNLSSGRIFPLFLCFCCLSSLFNLPPGLSHGHTLGQMTLGQRALSGQLRARFLGVAVQHLGGRNGRRQLDGGPLLKLPVQLLPDLVLVRLVVDNFGLGGWGKMSGRRKSKSNQGKVKSKTHEHNDGRKRHKIKTGKKSSQREEIGIFIFVHDTSARMKL